MISLNNSPVLIFEGTLGATPFKTSPVCSFRDGKDSEVLYAQINPRACGKLCNGKTGLWRTTAVVVPPGKVGGGTNGNLDCNSGILTSSKAGLFVVLRINFPSAKKKKYRDIITC